MKIISIGDTHGRDYWKKIVNHEIDADKIVFIGDYFDTHDKITTHQQILNFKDILAYKKENIDKVILLLGNHDWHYLKTSTESYSGFQPMLKTIIGGTLQEVIDEGLIQMCFVWKNFIFTHAGVTKTYARDVLELEDPEGSLLELTLNDLLKCQPNAFKFRIGANFSRTGNDVTQSPIWVRPESLALDILDKFTMVVGHTQTPKLQLNMFGAPIVMIDTLGYSKEYLIINNSELTIGKL